MAALWAEDTVCAALCCRKQRGRCDVAAVRCRASAKIASELHFLHVGFGLWEPTSRVSVEDVERLRNRVVEFRFSPKFLP